jgi:hypothetical protein
MPMRTTLTLEDDVADRLHQVARELGLPFKTVVNEALRAGLSSGLRTPDRPFSVHARAMGLRPGLDLDDVGEVLDRVEGLDRS